MAQINAEGHWKATSHLMWIALAIWAFFAFVIHFFVNSLNEIVILGFPLGYYMGSQGSLIVFVVLIFYYAWRMNQLDQQYGLRDRDRKLTTKK